MSAAETVAPRGANADARHAAVDENTTVAADALPFTGAGTPALVVVGVSTILVGLVLAFARRARADA